MSGKLFVLPPELSLMPLLAVDTAIHQCAAAVISEDGHVVLRAERLDKGHAERLPGMVDEVLAQAGIPFRHLTALGCTVGPGSFTGIRVALSLARGYALALKLPLCGVTTLEALAAPCLGAGLPVLAAINAGRGELYAQLFGADGAARSKPACIAVADAVVLASFDAGIVAGSGAAAVVGQKPGWTTAQHDVPDVAAVARIALQRATEGLAPSCPPSPLYLRPPDAVPSSYRLERVSDFFV